MSLEKIKKWNWNFIINTLLSIVTTAKVVYDNYRNYESLDSWYKWAILALAPVLFIFYSKLYEFLYRKLKEIFKEMSKRNKIFLGIVSILFITYIVASFINCKTFITNSKPGNDWIYTSDTMTFLRNDAWILNSNGQNDLRQPLFSIFASVFVAPIMTIFDLFSYSIYPAAYTYAITNVLLMIITGYIISSWVTKEESKRTGFMALYFSTFPFLLFSVMIEQYPVAVFWLVIFIDEYIKKKQNREISYIAATRNINNFRNSISVII